MEVRNTILLHDKFGSVETIKHLDENEITKIKKKGTRDAVSWEIKI